MNNVTAMGGCTGAVNGTAPTVIIANSDDPFGDGSLMAKWMMDDDFTDLLGNYDATLHGTVPFIEGKFNKAVSFTNNVVNTLTVLNKNPLKLQNQSFSCFIKINSNTQDSVIFNNCSKAEASGNVANGGVRLGLEGGKVFAEFYLLNDETTTDSNGNTSSSYSVKAMYNTSLTEDIWYSLCYTLNSNTIKVYLDGVLVSSCTSVQDITFGVIDDNISFGCLKYDASSSYPYDGLIDQAEFYNKVLTAVEVLALNTQTEPPSLPTTVGLVAYYPLGTNSEDSWTQELDGVDSGVTYDGDSVYCDGINNRVTTPIVDSAVFVMSFWSWVGDSLGGSSFGNFNSDKRLNIKTYFNSISNPSLYRQWRDGDTSGTYNYGGFYNSGLNTPEAGSWVHFYFEVQKGTQYERVLINGNVTDSVSSITYSGNTYKEFDDSVVLGVFTDNNTTSYREGKTRMLRIYDRSLTEAEILAIYNAELI